MPVTDIGDIIEVSLQGEFDATEDVVNVFQFKADVATVLSEADFATDLKDLVEAILVVHKVMVSSYTIFRRFRARFVNKVDAGRLIELDAPVPGTAAGDPSPSGVAALLVFRTGTPKVVLKKYVGTVSESDVSGNAQFTAPFLVKGATYIATMLSAIVTTENVWHYSHYDVDTDSEIRPISGYANAEPAYQRRRRRGHGS